MKTGIKSQCYFRPMTRAYFCGPLNVNKSLDVHVSLSDYSAMVKTHLQEIDNE